MKASSLVQWAPLAPYLGADGEAKHALASAHYWSYKKVHTIWQFLSTTFVLDRTSPTRYCTFVIFALIPLSYDGPRAVVRHSSKTILTTMFNMCALRLRWLIKLRTWGWHLEMGSLHWLLGVPLRGPAWLAMGAGAAVFP